jgi:DNA-binding MurR/RpiR family transcriptional regulator
MNGMTPEGSSGDVFALRLASHGASLAPAALRVARFIDANRPTVLASSAADLAARVGTSDATVIRTVQALGFAGLGALKQALLDGLGGRSTPADDMRRTLDDVGAPGDAASAIGMVLDIHAEAFAALCAPGSRARIAAAVAALHPAARIMVFGIGPSAALAGYVATLLARAGRRSAALDVTGIMLADRMLDLGAGDALLVLAYGRPYREVLAVFAEARRLALPVVLVTDAPDSKLARAATVVLAAQRGRSGRVALHGATLVGLEALVLGLAALAPGAAMDALGRLNVLRHAVSGQRHDIG